MSSLPSVSALHKAGKFYYNQLLEQSRLMSYVDAFELFALIAICLVPLGLFLNVDFQKKKEAKKKN